MHGRGVGRGFADLQLTTLAPAAAQLQSGKKDCGWEWLLRWLVGGWVGWLLVWLVAGCLVGLLLTWFVADLVGLWFSWLVFWLLGLQTFKVWLWF